VGGGSELGPLEGAASAFAPGEPLLDVTRHGSGHIHETWIARAAAAGAARRLLLQRLNTAVFPDPGALMENLVRVTAHLREKLRSRGIDVQRRCPCPLRTGAGGWIHADPDGGLWRAFAFVENARSADTVEGPLQAFEAARAFGAFAAQLSDLPGPPLRETIPHFHDLGRRVSAFDAALRADACGRAGAVGEEVRSLRRALAALERALPARRLAALPRRIAHHDCKLNNLLLDARTGEALCVIDLDTVMPGTLLSDFGGLVRTATCRAAEDERELEKIDVDLELFEALARGYLAGAGALLGEAERDALASAGALLTLLDATRFLTDHLSGDVYFRVHREGHNLDRARAQLRLAERMLEREPEAAALVARLARGR
jgi:hypothetical protein